MYRHESVTPGRGRRDESLSLGERRCALEELLPLCVRPCLFGERELRVRDSKFRKTKEERCGVEVDCTHLDSVHFVPLLPRLSSRAPETFHLGSTVSAVRPSSRPGRGRKYVLTRQTLSRVPDPPSFGNLRRPRRVFYVQK